MKMQIALNIDGIVTDNPVDPAKAFFDPDSPYLDEAGREGCLKGLSAMAELSGVGLYRPEHSTTLALGDESDFYLSTNPTPKPGRFPVTLDYFYGKLIGALNLFTNPLVYSGDYLQKVLKTFGMIMVEDLTKISTVIRGKPITVRLLDPPPDEFINYDNHKVIAGRLWDIYTKAQDAYGRGYGYQSPTKFERTLLHLAKEGMMGVRGIWLCLAYPELLREHFAAIHSVPFTRILLPMVSSPMEVMAFWSLYSNWLEKNGENPRPIGVMLETPAACLLAKEIAALVDFVSFGSNDLEQFTTATDRNSQWLERIKSEVKSKYGVAVEHAGLSTATWELTRMAIRSIRASKPECKIGACGAIAATEAGALAYRELGCDYISVDLSSLVEIHEALSTY